MIEIYLLGATFFLLALFLIFLPLRLTWMGRVVVLMSGAGISFLAYFGISVFSYWVILPIIVILSALLSYEAMKNTKIFKTFQKYKKKVDQRPELLFSYEELKERARHGETIDQYYTDSAKLVKADEAQAKTIEREEVSSHQLGYTEIDQLLQDQHPEETVHEEPNVTEMVFDHPEINVSSHDLNDESRIVSINQEETEHQDEQESEYHSEPEPSDSAIPPINEHPSELLPLDHHELENQLEEIDFSQRALASGKFDEKNAEPPTDFDISDDDEDLIEVRKRLFANLDKGSALNDDHEKIKPSILQPVNDSDHLENEVEKRAKQDGQVKLDNQRTVSNNKQAKQDVQQTAAANRFSSPQLEAAFDDLEELYLERKASEKNEEEHE